MGRITQAVCLQASDVLRGGGTAAARRWHRNGSPVPGNAALQCALFTTGNRSMLPDSESLLLLVTREMPFGKHKGTLIADLPGNYLNWFAREGFPPGEIGRLLALMHELDHNGLKDLLKPLRARLPKR